MSHKPQPKYGWYGQAMAKEIPKSPGGFKVGDCVRHRSRTDLDGTLVAGPGWHQLFSLVIWQVQWDNNTTHWVPEHLVLLK